MKQMVITKTYSEREVPLVDILKEHLREVRVFDNELVLYKKGDISGYISAFGSIQNHHVSVDAWIAIVDPKPLATKQGKPERIVLAEALATIPEEHFNIDPPPLVVDA